MRRYELTDNEWERIEHKFREKEAGTPWRAPKPARTKMNGLVWVARTGSPWCELPEEYGSWHTAYNNFRKWTDDGTISRIFTKISPKSEETEEIQLDGTYIRAHQHSAGVKKFKFHRACLKI